jgi:hypothetical protein
MYLNIGHPTYSQAPIFISEIIAISTFYLLILPLLIGRFFLRFCFLTLFDFQDSYFSLYKEKYAVT